MQCNNTINIDVLKLRYRKCFDVMADISRNIITTYIVHRAKAPAVLGI